MKTKNLTIRKQRRIFSEALKKQVVKDIEEGRCTVLQASKEFFVSDRSVYNWLDRYSRYLQKNKTLIVEDKSESYRSKELEKEIAKLEAALGRKQMEVDFLNKIIDLANENYQTDLKKNIPTKPSPGSEQIKRRDTGTK
jgi:transposase